MPWAVRIGGLPEARPTGPAGSSGPNTECGWWNGAGTSGTAGGPGGPGRGLTGPALGAGPAAGRRSRPGLAGRRDAGAGGLRAGHQRGGAHRLSGGAAAAAAVRPGRPARGPGGGRRRQLRRPGPRHAGADAEATNGRGLELVEMLCERWGWYPDGTGKRVWCEIGPAVAVYERAAQPVASAR
ncbi:hypothetical protein KCH_44370 [Kitasatospora cheerisanensis KCTC 2395]|uniref:ATP-binding protein n=1 Tax=Kitasatospora cheerisanensis KCTC 2395 TaxID=1348663 RepID=A0A066YQH1_9ACTN|nr:hypothetical protein KCH_44370 [Kitasatospora cheerisanensis KCTC 2395]